MKGVVKNENDNPPAAAVSLPPCEDTIQKRIADWYQRNGGHADVTAALNRIESEMKEIRRCTTMAEVREESADVAMCLLMAAEIAGFDLIDAVREKLAINERRRWTVDANGCLHHVKGSDPRESATGKEKVSL